MTPDQPPEFGRRVTLVTAGAVAITMALLAMPVSQRDVGEIVVAGALGAVLIVVSAARRLAPRAVDLGVPLGYILVVAVLRDAAGGGSSGFGGLFLLPIIFLALFSGRVQLFVGLGAMAAANIVPLVVVGGSAYPVSTWRGTLVQVGAAAVAGHTIQNLVGRIRAHAAATLVQNQRLQELDRLKDEFVSLISHELRTPLTSIVGYVEMLVEEGTTTLSGDQRSFLATVERNTIRLSKLVDDLLFMARLEEGRIEVRKASVDLHTVLAQAADSARPAADAKRVAVDLELDTLPSVHGDRDRLAQLVDNLVSNAVKFTPSGGTVTIRAAGDGRRVELAVADTGVGIPADELDHLFERFYRASTARETEIPGTGLGLAISQSIAEAHGTQIRVSSTVGVGTTFTLELPVDEPDLTVRSAA